jgi:hypothetical protein
MHRDSVKDILDRLPAHDLSKVQVILKNAFILSIETVVRYEQNYFLMRGREGGTTDEGRAFFISYDDVVTLKIERPMKLSELNKLYGVDSGVDAEDKLAENAEHKGEGQNKPETTTPKPVQPSPPVDPAQIAKNNLLDRLRAARTAAGAPR